jgi:glycine/D-amino acid oxidase-like deaminating enzyme
MNLRSGYPFWLAKNGLPFDYPKLEKSIKADVIIMGGGISGALMAYHLINAADPYLYMRSTKDRRILIGGRDEEFYSPAKRDLLLPGKIKQLVKDFNKVFPDIEFKPEFSWAGTFGATKDGLPFIGHYKKLPNSLFALGFGGNGITFSLIAAEILTAVITGKKNNDTSIFSFERM